MTNSEIAKELVVSAIQNGLIEKCFNMNKSTEENNADTAKSIGEMYEIVFKQVVKSHR